jgi:hypothetical protein
LTEDGIEPPVPAGLAELSAPLKSLADFLRLDDDLLAAAARASASLPEQAGPPQQEWRSWIQSLGEAEKDAWLYRVASGDAAVQWELRQRFQSHLDQRRPQSAADRRRRRSVSDLLVARDECIRQRRRREAEERARTERKQAAVRKVYLKELGQREDAVRSRIAALIETKQGSSYAEAVQLLVDLRDAAALHDRAEAIAEYVTGLRDRNAKKPALLRRLDQAGL